MLFFLLPNAVIWQQNYTKRKSLIYGVDANCCATDRLREPHRTSRSLHEWSPEAQTTGATDTKAPEAWSRGRSQTLFYNERRPHSSSDRRTPDEAYFAVQTIAAAPR